MLSLFKSSKEKLRIIVSRDGEKLTLRPSNDIAMQQTISAARLRLARPYLHGHWSGYFDEVDDGQQVAILAPAA
jgi:hypothetical protein